MTSTIDYTAAFSALFATAALTALLSHSIVSGLLPPLI